MQNLRAKILSLILLGAAPTSHANPSEHLDQKQFLLEQVYNFEAHFRDDLVQQALYKLQLIAPKEPEIIAAQIRLALRKGDEKLATELLEQLKQLAPDSTVYKHAKLNLALAQSKEQSELQQARLLVAAGRYQEAKKLYDTLFQNDPPTSFLAVEYWSMMSHIPGQEEQALEHLQEEYSVLQKHHIIQNNSSTNTVKDWLSLLSETLSKLTYAEGKKVYKVGNLSLAKQRYEESLRYNPKNDDALIGLADVAFDHKEFHAAEQAYKKADSLYPTGSVAVYGLVSVYRRQSPEKALDYLNHLPADKQLKFKEIRTVLESDIIQKKAEQYEAQKQWRAALVQYRMAYHLTPQDPWLNLHLAKVMYQLGQKDAANNLMNRFVLTTKKDSGLIYVYMLYLSGSNQNQKALNYLRAQPKQLVDQPIRLLAERLKNQLIEEQKQKALERARKAIEFAQKIRDGGDLNAANSFLFKQPQLPIIRLKLADWALEDGKLNEALAYYRKVRATEPKDSDAILGEIETLVAGEQFKDARQLLIAEQPNETKLSLGMQRRVAKAWILN